MGSETAAKPLGMEPLATAQCTLRDKGVQEAGVMLLEIVPGETRRDAAPPPSKVPTPGPAMKPLPVAGVRVPARAHITIITTIAIVPSVLEPMVLMLLGTALRLGVCWRSACAAGTALGFFDLDVRCHRDQAAQPTS